MRKNGKLPLGTKASVSKLGFKLRSRDRTLWTFFKDRAKALTFLVTVITAVVGGSWTAVTFFFKDPQPPNVITATHHSNAAGRDINLFGLDEEKTKRAFAEAQQPIVERLGQIQADVARVVSKTDTPAIGAPLSQTLPIGSPSLASLKSDTPGIGLPSPAQTLSIGGTLLNGSSSLAWISKSGTPLTGAASLGTWSMASLKIDTPGIGLPSPAQTLSIGGTLLNGSSSLASISKIDTPLTGAASSLTLIRSSQPQQAASQSPTFFGVSSAIGAPPPLQTLSIGNPSALLR